MSDIVGEAIAHAVKRFSVSKPLNVQNPQGVGEVASAAISSDVEKGVVQIGIDQDSVLLVDPETSKILDKKPKAEAYMQFIGATKADHRFKRKLFGETLGSAQQHMRFSLIAASLGFLIVLGGVVAMMLGYSEAGLVTSAAGIVSELVSVLFFNQAKHFSQRLDNTLSRLLDVEGFFRAFAIVEQLPEGNLRSQLLEAIVMKMIGLESGNNTAMNNTVD